MRRFNDGDRVVHVGWGVYGTVREHPSGTFEVRWDDSFVGDELSRVVDDLRLV